MSMITFLITKDSSIYIRQGGSTGDKTHIARDMQGIVIELSDKHIAMRYEFDSVKHSGIFTRWEYVERLIKTEFPEYFI